MKTNTTHTTADLEPALRFLSANPDKKVSFVATKFKLSDKVLWAWLGSHNHGKKELPAHRIDNALAEEKGKSAPKKTVPAAVGERITSALKKPSIVEISPSAPAAVRPPTLGSNLGRWLEQQKVPIRGQIQCFQVEVTPALAASWLMLNDGNRNPSKAKIRRFTAAIRAGKWAINGETIKFSSTGCLLDGQSRLRAIVMAGVPAVLEIRGGLPQIAQKSMDIGEARKGTHTLEMMGEKYPNILSPALRWIFRWENGSLMSRTDHEGNNVCILENMEIEPMLKRHDGLRASVGYCVSTGYKVADLMPPGEAAFFHYLLGLASAQKRDEFFHSLATGLGVTDKSPAYHLREKLQADRAAARRMGQRERMALVIKAWNAHFSGDSMTRLSFIVVGVAKEAFPSIAGVKAPEKAAA